MATELNKKTRVTQMSDTDDVVMIAGGKVARMQISDFRSHLNDNDNQVLNDLAFYIDVNEPCSLGAARVDVGGNMHMEALWEANAVDALMDADGNYCELNPSDCRYTREGEAVVDMDTGEVLEKWAKCDFVKIIPQYYGCIQTVTVGATTRLRPWFSLVPLPGGYIIPQQVVGKFKASLVGGAMRSLPGKVPDNSKTINVFWNQAQARSKNHGLANLDFRNHLLFYMMAKYGWRDSQNCKTGDGTPVWGVGLDGTESKGSDKFANQKDIKTGHTLSLGRYDGKAAVADSDGNTVHGVSVCGFENPWGQYWEMVQGLCSVGDDVYFWRGNTMPAGTPTAATFAKIDHVLLRRATSGSATGMNIIAGKDGQGCYMIPEKTASGVSYGDYYSYGASGQLWLFGGYSYNASACGLASAASASVGSSSDSTFSARLAFYGTVRKVSPAELARLAV